NPAFLQRDAGVVTTATGEKVPFAGMFMDHGDILDSFYRFWQQHGQPAGLNIRETLALKTTIPQSWYDHVLPHLEGTDTYKTIQNPFPDDSSLRPKTP